MKRLHFYVGIALIITILFSFNFSSAQQKGIKYQETILSVLPVDCDGICTISSWNMDQISAIVWRSDSTICCAVNVTVRSRRCWDNGTASYINEVEILRIEPQANDTCNCTVQEIMNSAIKYVLNDIRVILNDTNLVYFDVYVRTSKCWKVDPLDNFALKSCDTTKCYQTKYGLYHNTGYDMYVRNHETEGNNEPNPCNELCQDVITSHDIPDGFLFYQYGQDCPQNCYWRIIGNSNTDKTHFLGTLHNESLIFKTNWKSRMIIYEDYDLLGINGFVGIGTDHWGQKARSLLDVRGTITTGGPYSHEGSTFTDHDGIVTFFPGGWPASIYHIDNRFDSSNYGFHISHGPEPGLAYPHDNLFQPPKGLQDIVSIYAWGKIVGIGCSPYDNRRYDWDPNGITNAKFSCAGPLGMLTVSDELYPYPISPLVWSTFGGNSVILRLERRNNNVDDNNKAYKLISAGHNTEETFIVWPDRVKIGPEIYDKTVRDFRLSVDGLIVTKELVVTVDNWSDFVFEKNYSLPSLNEIEDYIKINGHLPGIPSADEVKKKGVEVGEIQSKLLQKIEELTLYLIDLKKENKNLQKQINSLKAKSKK